MTELGLGDLFTQPMLKLLHQFEEAKTFGSLIQPCHDERPIAFVRRAIDVKDLGGQLFIRETHAKFCASSNRPRCSVSGITSWWRTRHIWARSSMNAKLKNFVRRFPAERNPISTGVHSAKPSFVHSKRFRRHDYHPKLDVSELVRRPPRDLLTKHNIAHCSQRTRRLGCPILAVVRLCLDKGHLQEARCLSKACLILQAAFRQRGN